MPYHQTRTPIGQRRERAILQVLLMADDGLGGQVPSSSSGGDGWQEVARPWYRPVVLDERTNESLIAAKITARQAYHFDMRYREDVESSGHRFRMLWRGKTLQVHAVTNDDARRQRLVLLCAETQ